MQGQIIKTFPAKGFGFIKPDDGSDDVYYSHKYCQGSDILAVGDKVKFDIDPTKKGKNRSATSVSLINGPVGTATTAKPTIGNKFASATTNTQRPDLEVVVPMDPDNDGSFPIQVRTYKKGKPQKRSFRIHSANLLMVEWTGLGEEGQQTNRTEPGHSFVFETTKGLADLCIAFDPVQITIQFILDDGFTVKKTLVK